MGLGFLGDARFEYLDSDEMRLMEVGVNMNFLGLDGRGVWGFSSLIALRK